MRVQTIPAAVLFAAVARLTLAAADSKPSDPSAKAPAAAAETPAPRGCAGSATLGTFRILAQRATGGETLPLKSISRLPENSKLIWEPVHIPKKETGSAEVTAVLAPVSGDDLIVLKPHKAAARAEWQIPTEPTAVALVIGPAGISEGKVKSLVNDNQDLVNELADYADQSSKVEALVQEISDAESGNQADAALKGIAARYGVASTKLNPQAPTGQQASALLGAVVPTAGAYDPLATSATQMQQSAGLAASVAGMFFGNFSGVAFGGAAFLTGIKGALFPNSEFRSAFAQNADAPTATPDANKDALALCTKNAAPKARTRVSYLWAYRVPNLKTPEFALTGSPHVPEGTASAVAITTKTGAVRDAARARDWRLIPISGGTGEAIPVHVSNTPNALDVDLKNPKIKPGDYRLAATWDWDSLSIGGILHVQPLGDLSHAELAPESRRQLIEGNGAVAAKLTGGDFEFVEHCSLRKPGAPAAQAKAVDITLPLGKGAGPQSSATVSLDATARGSYLLALTQSGGRTNEIPVTVLPPNPTLTGLPIKVNQGDVSQSIRLHGTGLDRIESITTPAGELSGAFAGPDWQGALHLRSSAEVGTLFALTLRVKGLDTPVTIPAALKVYGARPVVTAVEKSTPASLNLTLQPDELPSGIATGLTIAVRQYPNASDLPPAVELSCKSGPLRRALTLVPDDHSSGADLSVAAPGLLFLSIDPGKVGYPGCQLAARVDSEPEGQSDPYVIGRVIRVPRLDQFTLTNESLDASTYLGILKGRDLDVLDKAGWDAQHGVRVLSVPSPTPGDPAEQTLRIALPWPAPSPHAPLYIWLRGEEHGRKTSVTD